MSGSCFIGIDQGSSSTKALAVSSDGQVAFRARKALSPPMREGERVEQDPMEILSSVTEALSDAAGQAKAAGLVVAGIGLACQRSSCLVWDESTGEPLSPVISWRDTRAAATVDGLAGEADRIFTLTGLPLTPYYAASKLRWLADAGVAAGAKAAVFGTLSSFLCQRLAGGRKAVIDHTNAARTQLMNITTLGWDDGLRELFGVKGTRLPELVPTAHRFGDVTTSAGTVPLLAVIGDQQAAMLGLGVVEKGDGGINYGTGGFLMVNTGEKLASARGLMASVHYSLDSMKNYLVEGSVNAAGDALEWLRQRFHLFKEYDEVDDLCWKAAEDVVVFIGLNGTGAPHWEREISSAIHGLTVESGAADVVRGTVEGIAFFMKDIADAVREAGVEPRSFAISGGLSSLTYLTQLQCDMLGATGVVRTEQEVSALGAALLAGLQAGAWTVSDIKRITSPGEAVQGEPNPGAARRYRRWSELHRAARALDGVA